MQICNNCYAKQMDGTIFCAECGASLLAPRRQETTASLGLGDQDPGSVTLIPAPEPVAFSQENPSLTVVILNSGRRLTLPVADDLLIGRRDEPRGIFPDIDLSSDGGYDAGVSRRHALLAFKNGSYQVEDLGSSNGTFVNGRRLTPQSTMTLQNGDELKCGTLVMRIELGQ